MRKAIFEGVLDTRMAEFNKTGNGLWPDKVLTAQRAGACTVGYMIYLINYLFPQLPGHTL